MNTAKLNHSSAKKSIWLNRTLYGIFVLTGLYFLMGRSTLHYGILNLGMALIFDPFDYCVTWNFRPRYQKAWLFIHVSAVFCALAYALLSGL